MICNVVSPFRCGISRCKWIQILISGCWREKNEMKILNVIENAMATWFPSKHKQIWNFVCMAFSLRLHAMVLVWTLNSTVKIGNAHKIRFRITQTKINELRKFKSLKKMNGTPTEFSSKILCRCRMNQNLHGIFQISFDDDERLLSADGAYGKTLNNELQLYSFEIIVDTRALLTLNCHF